jgi:hypothetical protein
MCGEERSTSQKGGLIYLNISIYEPTFDVEPFDLYRIAAIHRYYSNSRVARWTINSKFKIES